MADYVCNYAAGAFEYGTAPLAEQARDRVCLVTGAPLSARRARVLLALGIEALVL